MASGRSSAQAQRAVDGLWVAFLGIEPLTTREGNWYDHLIGSLRDLTEAREHRMTSVDAAVPTIVWIVLLVGGALTIGYTYLYGVRSQAVQVALTVVLAALIGLVVSIIVALDHPFTGDAAVSPEAFEAVRGDMDRHIGR
jgi:hypothetical protein